MNPQIPVTERRSIRLLAIALVFLGIVLVYAPRLHDFFTSDDFSFLHSCIEFSSADQGGWHRVVFGESELMFRPVLGVFGWLLFGLCGLEPFRWHITSLALHLLAVGLTIALVRRFVRSQWAGVAAGALFGLHYLNAESVTWVSGRTSLLVTVLILACVVVETTPRNRSWAWQRWLGLIAAMLALLSKENATALPLLLMLIPESPYDLDRPALGSARFHLRDMLTTLRRQVMRMWPYIALTMLFLAFRFSAIVASTESTAYKLEVHANVLKNLAFVSVSSLFPLDFRAALAAWNNWSQTGSFSALAEFFLSSPAVIVGTIAAGLIWISILLWGHRAARRSALWVFVAALPVLFFSGTGERLMYTSLPGAAGALGILVATWHRTFVTVFTRAGRWIAPILIVIVLAFHVNWLDHQLRDWESAAELSHAIVGSLEQIAHQIPADAKVGFLDLPDNIDGAWVFRTGINHAFALYAGRPDVYAVQPTPQSPDDWDDSILRYRWNGEEFVFTEAAEPDARTDPQSEEP